MFTFLGLRNFRAFEEVALDLAPITILVGPNNSGKSSIVSGLRMLAQTMAGEDLRVPLMLKGAMGDFGTYKDVVFQHNRRKHIGITLGTTLPKRFQAKEIRLQLTFAYRAQRREVILRDSAWYDETGRKIFTTRSSSDPGRHVLDFPGFKSSKKRQERVRMIHFLFPAWSILERFTPLATPETFSTAFRKTLLSVQGAYREFLQGLRSVEYIGPFRAEPKRTNLFSGEIPKGVGMDGARAIDMLAFDYLRRGRRKKELLGDMIRWLSKAGIAGDIKVHVLSDRHYEVLMQHKKTGEYENLADVGYGSSQVLPVLAGGYSLTPGTTFVVEQPEIHLHPKAQAELGDFFYDLYKRRCQCIVETHSEHLILRLQRHVARGAIKASDVLVYYVHASSERKVVVRLTLGEDGIFQEKWPTGFFEERLEEVTALARSQLTEAE